MNISSAKCKACDKDFTYDFGIQHVDPICRELFCNECYEQEQYNFREVCKSNPLKFMAHLKRRNEPVKNPQYFVTFTWNNSIPHDVWLDKLKVALSYKFILNFKCFIEHPNSNIHCHALITTKYRVCADKHFGTFKKKCGHVDVRLVSVDNGVLDYAVGTPIFERVEDIKIEY